MSASFVYLDENNNLSTTNSTLSGLFPDNERYNLNVDLEYKNKFLFGTTASDNIKVGNLSIKEVDIISKNLNISGNVEVAQNINVTDTLVSNKLQVKDKLLDSNGAEGTSGQTLKSTSTGKLEWGVGGGVEFVTDSDALSSTAQIGSLAVTNSDNIMYVKTPQGWYKVATISNIIPTLTITINPEPAVTNINNNISLIISTTYVFTNTANDPEGFTITYDHQYTSSQSPALQSITQNENVFTLVTGANAGDTDSVTFRCFDGAHYVTETYNITLLLPYIGLNHMSTISNTNLLFGYIYSPPAASYFALYNKHYNKFLKAHEDYQFDTEGNLDYAYPSHQTSSIPYTTVFLKRYSFSDLLLPINSIPNEYRYYYSNKLSTSWRGRPKPHIGGTDLPGQYHGGYAACLISTGDNDNSFYFDGEFTGAHSLTDGIKPLNQPGLFKAFEDDDGIIKLTLDVHKNVDTVTQWTFNSPVTYNSTTKTYDIDTDYTGSNYFTGTNPDQYKWYIIEF